MKKIILSICILAAAAMTAAAIPANPRVTKVRQPDGTMITLRLQGDEFCSWGTTPDGRTMMAGEDGFYRTVSASALREAKARTTAQRAARRNVRKNANEISTGNKKFLVVLVEFADVPFKKANADFDKMMNQTGYSAYGATGSVADYYKDQSSGKFNPIFDVVGPVKVSKDMEYYGKHQGSSHDANPGQMVKEAVDSIYKKGLVKFSDYDNDSDGIVDNIYVFYAGYSEASGGGAKTIWPHASWVNSATEYDGVYIGSYACGSELKGNSGESMDGIGTFCHEFGHVLGLPDFYDTNYEEDGQGDGLLSFSLMDSGCYNNGSNTPPNLNGIERNMLGWMDEFEYLTTSGHKTLKSIANNVSYIAPSENEGEFFLMEVRDGKGWDAHIYMSYDNGNPVGPTASGLVVYHVDMSDNIVYNNYTAKYLWERTNRINCYANHQCFYVLPSYSDYEYNLDAIPFPGKYGINSFTDTSNPSNKFWDGSFSTCNLTNITYADGEVTLDLKVKGDLADVPFKTIAMPKTSWKAGDTFTFQFVSETAGGVPVSTAWYLDDSRQSAASVKLTSGKHTIKAIATYSDGSTEEVIQVINVE